MLGSSHSRIDEETADIIRQTIRLNFVEPVESLTPGMGVKIMSGQLKCMEGTLLHCTISARIVIYVKDIYQPFVIRTLLANLRKI
jgi:hypothetical protein